MITMWEIDTWKVEDKKKLGRHARVKIRKIRR